jgi:hypothetical protein
VRDLESDLLLLREHVLQAPQVAGEDLGVRDRAVRPRQPAEHLRRLAEVDVADEALLVERDDLFAQTDARVRHARVLRVDPVDVRVGDGGEAGLAVGGVV